MLFLIFKSCILFSSAEIPLTGDKFSDSDQMVDQEVDSADFSLENSLADEVVMPSHLKLYDFPPPASGLNLMVDSHELIFDDINGCSGLSEDDENLVYNYVEQQFQTVAIPENLYLVEVDFGLSFDGFFDDHIVVTINDVFVYTSDLYIPIILSNPNDFQWAEIVNQPMNGLFEPYCLVGCSETYDNFATTGITYQGPMSISLSSSDVMTILGSDSELVMGIYVFGDNDFIDCSLQNMRANVRFVTTEE